MNPIELSKEQLYKQESILLDACRSRCNKDEQ